MRCRTRNARSSSVNWATMLTAALVLAAIPAGVAGAPSQPRRARQDESAKRIARLAGLCRVWGNAKYFHPALADRPDIDWDAALVAAIPRVRDARNAAEYAAAVQTMLDVLEDPVTRVVPPAAAEPAHTADRAFGVRWADDNVLVVTAGNYYELSTPEVQQKLTETPAMMATARAVVFDLRSSSPVDPYGRLMLTSTLAPLERLMIDEPLATAATRRRVYYGYSSPGPFDSGQYRTGLFTRDGTTLRPATNARAIPSVTILNQHAGVLAGTIPMQAAGRGLIVFEGDVRESSVADVATVELADGLVAHVRHSEAVFPDGMSGDLLPDAVAAPAASVTTDAALERALALAREFHPSHARRTRLPASATSTRERAYAEMRFPALEYRLLAAFRIWNAIEYFYPYKQLLDRPWADAIVDAIPRLETARDAREYGLAVASLASRIQDSHAYTSGRVFDEEIVGDGYPPIRVRMIENTPVVTAIYDADAARRAGVEIGDVVLRVDGIDAATRLDESARLISASTPQSNADKASLVFMNGRVGSTVTLTLRDGSGREKQAVLERRHEDYTTLYHRERQGEIVRILPSNVGYVDLDRLPFDMVDSMFEQLKDTQAIIFDMRGYPNSTYFVIAPRLAAEARVVALIDTPLVGHGDPAPAFDTTVQTIEPAAGATGRYRGRTIMLIDERTMSQAEHTGLYLKAANGTTFVGSRTAGADGEITTITVPGGIAVGFTGQEVRHPDGRRLQRVGLIPDVEIRPTIAGIRAGRDEVLDAAIRLLNEP